MNQEEEYLRNKETNILTTRSLVQSKLYGRIKGGPLALNLRKSHGSLKVSKKALKIGSKS